MELLTRSLTNAKSEAAARALAATRNESQTGYPGTNLRWPCKLVSDEIPYYKGMASRFF